MTTIITRWTADNLDEADDWMPLDQRAELAPGCVTYRTVLQGGMPQTLTVWPNGRAAVQLNGNSEWGDYDASTGVLRLDAEDEDGRPITVQVPS